MSSGELQGHVIKRLVFAITGMFIITAGISLCTLAHLGTTAISAPMWVLTLIGGMSFGGWTILGNLAFFLVQLGLLRGAFPLTGWWQVPCTFLLGLFIDFWVWVLGDFTPTQWWWKSLQLLIGCCVLAAGIAIEVAPRILYVPAEGIVAVIAQVSGWPFDRVKVGFDTSLVSIALVLSLIFFKGIVGIGPGTLIAMLLVGILIGLVTPAVQRLLPWFLGLGQRGSQQNRS